MSTLIIEQLDTYGPESCREMTLAEAMAYNRELVNTHYENFSVISFLAPKQVRDDFANVYAFCRWADDLGDEVGDTARSLELLRWWREELDACYADQPRHPVFVGLRHTIEKFDIPSKPFEDLINAFIQDQTVDRYESWDQALDYCTRSADPVGRLVLMMLGYRDEARFAMSDKTCTALQLANFWQDVRRDILERDRIYVPADLMETHGLNHDLLVSVVNGNTTFSAEQEDAWRAVIKKLCDDTWQLFIAGRALPPTLAADHRSCVSLFSMGGESVLKLIQKQGYDTWKTRPVLSKFAKGLLAAKVLLGKARGIGGSRAVEPEVQ